MLDLGDKEIDVVDGAGDEGAVLVAAKLAVLQGHLESSCYLRLARTLLVTRAGFQQVAIKNFGADKNNFQS